VPSDPEAHRERRQLAANRTSHKRREASQATGVFQWRERGSIQRRFGVGRRRLGASHLPQRLTELSGGNLVARRQPGAPAPDQPDCETLLAANPNARLLIGSRVFHLFQSLEVSIGQIISMIRHL
jgi:hypothetical protein